jgi:hypothetical protein
MVVVPTGKHVTLRFTTSTVDWVGRVLTLVGLAGLVGLVWWGIASRREDDTTGVDRPRWRVRFPSRSSR